MFDLTDVKNTFDLIPGGTMVPAVVTSAEWKTSKAGVDYLQSEMTIFDGEWEGRKLWNNLNLMSTNETANNIAKAQLKTLVAGTGEATEQLEKDEVVSAIMESRVEVKVGVQRSDEYGDKNTVKSMKVWVEEQSNNVGF